MADAPLALPLIAITLVAEPLPESIVAPFAEHGFHYHQGTFELLARRQVAGDPVFLLWVADDWQRGLEQVEKLPESRRQRTLVVGERTLGSRQIHAAIDLGVLAVAAHPVPSWFLAPLRAAILRHRRAFQRDLVKAVEDLQDKVEHSPQSLMIRAAEVAGELLGAALAVATLKSSEGDQFQVLERAANGRILQRPWPQDMRRRQAPRGLSRLVHDRSEVLIIPSVLNSSLCEPGEGDDFFQAAVVKPLEIRQLGIDGHQRPVLASLNFYWRVPYLPTPDEIVALEVVAALATSSLARLLEQARFSNIHAVARSVLPQPGQSLAAGRLSGELHSDVASDLEHSGDPLEGFVRLMMRAYSGRLDLRELWVRLPRGERRHGRSSWVSLGSHIRNSQPPARARETGDEIAVVEVMSGEVEGGEVGGRGWAVQTLLKADAPHLGELIAIFASAESAWATVTEVQRLADDLTTAIYAHRRGGNTEALRELSTVPSRPEEAKNDLAKVVDMVRARTDSAGAKVYVVLRTAAGPKIWQMCHTWFPGWAPVARDVRAQKGLADWVLEHDDWLLIRRARAAAKTGEEPETCLTGRHGEVKILARSEREYWPDWPADKRLDSEKSLLFVPLQTAGAVTGVLAVWRQQALPYNRDIDTETLLYFAPHVVAACQRLLQLEKAQKEIASIFELGRQLASAVTLSQAYEAVVRGVGELADAAGVVLLHVDEAEPSGVRHLFMSALWTQHEAIRADLAEQLVRFLVPCDREPESWWLDVQEGLEERRIPLAFRDLLLPAATNGDLPHLAVALLDAPPGDRSPRFVSDDILDHFARSFLHSAAALLESFPDTLASRLLDHIGEASIESSGAMDVLAESARLLKSATSADAALIYAGTPRHMAVRSTWPESPQLRRLKVKKDSYSARSLLGKEPVRFLEVAADDSRDQEDPENLGRLSQAFGWDGVGSWLSCSIRHDQRSIGLIKILTRRVGSFLGKDHERVISLIADRTAGEMYKANRRVVLSQLLRVSNELAAMSGSILEQQMATRLQAWTAEILHRPKCRVAVVAHTLEGKRLIASGSADLPFSVLQRFERDSRAWETKLESGSLRRTASGRAYELRSPRGLAIPITLPGEQRLAGHLFLLDREPFADDEEEAALDAAHYMAIVLNGRRERIGWRETMGRFRHAVIGPVMGVTEAAWALAELSEEGGVDKERLAALRDRLREEAETLRLWRENGRFYLTDKAQLKIDKQALKPLVLRVLERFRRITAERGIHLDLAWNIGGELHFLFDREALDLAISNLLDNAQKYAYYNRRVTLGVDVDRGVDAVDIWVENIGHEIPRQVSEAIYRVGQRGARHDPFRAILGQGLGLPMVLAIVKAHDGELSHVCEKLGQDETTAKTPFRVRFTIELPYRRLS